MNIAKTITIKSVYKKIGHFQWTPVQNEVKKIIESLEKLDKNYPFELKKVNNLEKIYLKINEEEWS